MIPGVVAGEHADVGETQQHTGGSLLIANHAQRGSHIADGCLEAPIRRSTVIVRHGHGHHHVVDAQAQVAQDLDALERVIDHLAEELHALGGDDRPPGRLRGGFQGKEGRETNEVALVSMLQNSLRNKVSATLAALEPLVEQIRGELLRFMQNKQ